jgi:pyrroloquinoline-quinone synthase
MTRATAAPATREAFEARLRQIGAERYHDRHPFHHLLHSGGCTPDQVRAQIARWKERLA